MQAFKALGVGVGVGAAIMAGTLSGYVANPAGAQVVRPHIVGTWANDVNTGGSGGYRVWSNGRIDAMGGAPYFGSISDPAQSVVGFIGDNQSDGYWIITSNGHYYSRGTTCQDETMVAPPGRPRAGVVGAIYLPNLNEGFYMVTNTGRLYPFQCEFTY